MVMNPKICPDNHMPRRGAISNTHYLPGIADVSGNIVQVGNLEMS